MQGLHLRHVVAPAACGLPRGRQVLPVLLPRPCKPATVCCQSRASPDIGSAAIQDEKPKRRGRKKSQPSPDSSPQSQPPTTAAAPITTEAANSAEDATLDEEIKLQEQELGLTVDDLVQMQYEMPTEEELAREEQELLEQLQEEDPVAIQPELSAAEPAAGLQGQEQSIETLPGTLSRKAAVLLELITAAAGSDLDAKIAQFADVIDEEMLDLLRRRIDVVAKVDDSAAEQLRELESILWVVYQRNASSPALRLLDEVLDILGDDVLNEQGYAGQRLKAQARLREAFFGGGQQGMDIFEAAVALAEGGPLAAADLMVEQVDPVVFLGETTSVFNDAKESQTKLGADIQRAEKELDYVKKSSPEVLSSPEGKAHLAQLDKAKRLHSSRAVALGQLQDVMNMARQMSALSNMQPDDDFE